MRVTGKWARALRVSSHPRMCRSRRPAAVIELGSQYCLRNNQRSVPLSHAADKSDLIEFYYRFDQIGLSTARPMHLERQPRRFVYPKDGGGFDAPKIHVFTQLLSQNGLYLPKRWHEWKLLKNVLWSPLSTKMTNAVTWGSVNSPTVTNLGEGGAQKMTFICLKTARAKIAQKHFLESAEHING